MSIRRRLLLLLLLPLTALTFASVLTSRWMAQRAAERVFEQRLGDVARIVASGVGAEGDRVYARLPDDFARAEARDGVSDLHVSVFDPQGVQIVETGIATDGARRVARLKQTPLGTTRIEVSGVLETHNGPLQVILSSSWLVGFVQLDITLLLVWLGVHYGLRPLEALRGQIDARSPRDLKPLSTANVPTEARPLVDALNSLFDLLQEASRSQRQFVADTAHQLRTPLTGLIGHLELLIQAPEGAPLRERLGVLREGLARLAHSANQLLGLARADPAVHHDHRFEDVDLAALVEQTVEANLTRSLALGIDLGADVQPANTLGHPHLLADLLGNLVDNALNYAGLGARITVRCSMEAGAATLQVEDDGPGIPESERLKVRQRFYRLPGSGGRGCGLGLAIVDEIARLHGATLTLETGTGGKGMLARVRFRQR